MSVKSAAISVARLPNLIQMIRGEKVMLDTDLAELYGVAEKVLNQAVKRNRERFPEDFCFQLSAEEWSDLRAPATPTDAHGSALGNDPLPLRSQAVTLKTDGRGQHRKYRPYAFTEQGVAMLSSVLRSTRAVQVNIEIMRAFVRLRQFLLSNVELSRKLNALENKYDAQFKMVFDAIRQLMSPAIPAPPARREIGFRAMQKSGESRKK